MVHGRWFLAAREKVGSNTDITSQGRIAARAICHSGRSQHFGILEFFGENLQATIRYGLHFNTRVLYLFGRKCLVRFFYGKQNECAAPKLAIGVALFSHPFLRPRIRRRPDPSFGETSGMWDSRDYSLSLLFLMLRYHTTRRESVFIPFVEFPGTSLLMHPLLQRRLMK